MGNVETFHYFRLYHMTEGGFRSFLLRPTNQYGPHHTISDFMKKLDRPIDRLELSIRDTFLNFISV